MHITRLDKNNHFVFEVVTRTTSMIKITELGKEKAPGKTAVTSTDIPPVNNTCLALSMKCFPPLGLKSASRTNTALLITHLHSVIPLFPNPSSMSQMKHAHLNTNLLSSRTGAVDSLEVAHLLVVNSGPHFQGRCFRQDRDLALHPNTQGHDEAFDARKLPLLPTLEKPHRHYWITHS